MNSSPKILLIEDDVHVIRLWSTFFKEYPSIGTTYVHTIEAAREALNTQEFDLIFMDGNLTVSGPEPEPETLPLFLEIREKYLGKILFISNYDPYVSIMKKYGVTYVEKTDVPGFANSYFTKEDIKIQPSKNCYDLKTGNLLVINAMRNPFFAHKPAYIAEIVNVSPLELKIGEEVPVLKPHGYRILENESRLIQGNKEEQDALLYHYQQNAQEGALRSGLARFGGVLTEITTMPSPTHG